MSYFTSLIGPAAKLLFSKPAVAVGIVLAGTSGGTYQWQQYQYKLGVIGKTETELIRIFKSLDSDGSGFIDESELGQALASHGVVIDSTALHAMLAAADENKDGKLSQAEFLHMCKALNAKVTSIKPCQFKLWGANQDDHHMTDVAARVPNKAIQDAHKQIKMEK